MLCTLGLGYLVPAENAAKENNISPKNGHMKIYLHEGSTKTNGLSLDGHEKLVMKLLSSTTKTIYRFFNKKLIYKESLVNWDPIENTVLAMSK